MVVATYPVPLREDYTFRVIISQGDDIDDILAELNDDDKGYAEDKSGWSEFKANTFSLVVIDGGIPTIVHECDHIAFYICKHFGVVSQEFHAMLIEWLFSKTIIVFNSLEL